MGVPTTIYSTPKIEKQPRRSIYGLSTNLNRRLQVEDLEAWVPPETKNKRSRKKK